MRKRTFAQMNEDLTPSQVVEEGNTQRPGPPPRPVGDAMVIEEEMESSVMSNRTPQEKRDPQDIVPAYFQLLPCHSALQSPQRKTRLAALTDLLHVLRTPRTPLQEVETYSTQSIQLLRRRLTLEDDPHLQCLLVECLTALAQRPSVSSRPIFGHFMHLLESNDIKKSLRATTVQGILRMSTCKPPSPAMVENIEALCLRELQQRNVKIRQNALVLLSRLGTSTNLQQIIARVCETDPDPRVRASGFQAILVLHQRQVPLEIDLYRRAVAGMNDDHEEVKRYAVECMWILCNLHPLHVFTSQGGEQTRLVDDGFIRICNMINDISMPVRAKAARLLGGLRNVSTQYLLQAFSKELFGRSNKMKLSRTQGNEISAEGDFDLTQSGDVNVLDSGAGAFVHGLEDEYYQVRMATVDSICELSCGSTEFARMAVEFLVDMFSDEINAVRINSMHSLRKISSYIHLNEEQLQIALSSLEDVTGKLRYAMQLLLMSVRLSNIQSVYTSIIGLLNNLRRYPSDREQVYLTLRGIGEKHSSFVEYLVEDLLQLDLQFVQMEANVNDTFYIAKLIVLTNASVGNPHILSLLPPHTARHYRYLRGKFPRYFPEGLYFPEADQSLMGQGTTPSQLHTQTEAVLDIPTLFVSTWQKICEEVQDRRSFVHVSPRISAFSDSLAYIERTHGHLTPLLEFYGTQHSILTLILRAKTQQLKEETATVAADILRLSYLMEKTLFGLSTANMAQIHVIRLFAHALTAMASLSHSLPQGNFESTFRALLDRIKLAKAFCAQRAIEEPDTLVQVSTALAPFLTGESATPSASTLLDVLKLFQVEPFTASNQLKRIGGRITSPESNSENAQRFMPTIPLLVSFTAEVENMLDKRGLMVLITFPDHREQLVPIQESSILPISRFHCQIEASLSVETNHPAGWSEASCLTLQLVRTFLPDLPEWDGAILRAHRTGTTVSRGTQAAFAPFGPPVDFYIFPDRNYQPSKHKH